MKNTKIIYHRNKICQSDRHFSPWIVTLSQYYNLSLCPQVLFLSSLPSLGFFSLGISRLFFNQGSMYSLLNTRLFTWLSPNTQSDVTLHSPPNEDLFWTNKYLVAISPHPCHFLYHPTVIFYLNHSVLFLLQHLHHSVDQWPFLCSSQLCPQCPEQGLAHGKHRAKALCK